MITLNIAKLLADEGFGTLDTDIFWEDMPLDAQGNPKNGVWIVSRGAPVTRFRTTRQAFDIYSRHSNKVTSSQKLEDILDYLRDAYGEVCTLPTVPPYSGTLYSEVQLIPVSGIENVGTDEQDKVVRVISGEVIFKREHENAI